MRNMYLGSLSTSDCKACARTPMAYPCNICKLPVCVYCWDAMTRCLRLRINKYDKCHERCVRSLNLRKTKRRFFNYGPNTEPVIMRTK